MNEISFLVLARPTTRIDLGELLALGCRDTGRVEKWSSHNDRISLTVCADGRPVGLCLYKFNKKRLKVGLFWTAPQFLADAVSACLRFLLARLNYRRKCLVWDVSEKNLFLQNALKREAGRCMGAVSKGFLSSGEEDVRYRFVWVDSAPF